jgi:hypothetical protein
VPANFSKTPHYNISPKKNLPIRMELFHAGRQALQSWQPLFPIATAQLKLEDSEGKFQNTVNIWDGCEPSSQPQLGEDAD